MKQKILEKMNIKTFLTLIIAFNFIFTAFIYVNLSYNHHNQGLIASNDNNQYSIKVKKLQSNLLTYPDTSDNFFSRNINNYETDKILSKYELGKFNKYDLDSKFGFILQDYLSSYDWSKISQDDLKQKIELILMFEPDVSIDKQNGILTEIGLKNSISKRFHVIPGIILSLPLDKIIKLDSVIRKIPEIYRLFINNRISLDEYSINSADENVPESSSFNFDNWWLSAIGANDLNLNGSGVNIAILDTGISDSHVDLSQKSPKTFNLNFASEDNKTDPLDYEDHNSHGSHVAGIAAGLGLSSDGKYRGVAPGANLYNIKVANTSGSILSSDVISAVEWIVDSGVIDIISMSFGSAYPEVYDPETAALLNASQHGIVSFAAAGNSGPEYYTGGSPAAGISTISVGSINSKGEVSDFSSIGPSLYRHVMPDILTPGEDIISVEQQNSLLSRYRRYTNSYIRGKYTGSDYIPLSGTSMACPMASGAAAILLEKYPNLTPEGIRIALLKGTYLPNNTYNYSISKFDNGIGAGIINVSKSLEWLKNQDDLENLIEAFPNAIPYAPYDLLGYPGDKQSFNISVIYSGLKSANYNVELPSIDGVSISISNNTITFSNHSTEFLQINVSIDENSSIGLKQGLISIKNSSGMVVSTINISITVKFPKGSVYFDSFHGLNDIFFNPLSRYMQIDMYQAMKTLWDAGYKVKYQMDEWVNGYNSSENGRFLDAETVFGNDIVVLQPPVIPYSDYEREILTEYVNSGGSLLVLGTRYQSMAIDSLNDVLSEINCSISFNKENILTTTDVGLGLLLETYNVDDFSNDFEIIPDNSSLEFWYGATLDVNETEETRSIGKLLNKSVLAAYQGVSNGRGNIIVLSDYHWLINSIYREKGNFDNYSIILNNIASFLNNKSKNLGIDSRIRRINNSHEFSIDISLVNSTTNNPISSIIPGIELNVTLINPDNTLHNISVTETKPGIYSNISFTLDGFNNLPYKIQIDYSKDNISIEKSNYIFDFDNNVKILNETMIQQQKFYREEGQTNEINATLNVDSNSVKFYSSIISGSFINNNSAQENSFSLMKKNNTFFYSKINATPSMNSGYYTFFTLVNDTNGFFTLYPKRNSFIVVNNDPVIDIDFSYINQATFNSTQPDDSVLIQTADIQVPINFKVNVSENVTYEDSINEIKVGVTYLSCAIADSHIIPIQPNTIPYSRLNYTTSSKIFEGKYKIPAVLEFTGVFGKANITQKSYVIPPSSLVYASILWVSAIDSEGGIDDFIFILYVTDSGNQTNTPIAINLNDIIPIIITFIAVIGVIIFFARRAGKQYPKSNYSDMHNYPGRNRRGYDDYYTEYRPNYDNNIKFCHNCGKRLKPGEKFCPDCGAPQY